MKRPTGEILFNSCACLTHFLSSCSSGKEGLQPQCGSLRETRQLTFFGGATSQLPCCSNLRSEWSKQTFEAGHWVIFFVAPWDFSPMTRRERRNSEVVSGLWLLSFSGKESTTLHIFLGDLALSCWKNVPKGSSVWDMAAFSIQSNTVTIIRSSTGIMFEMCPFKICCLKNPASLSSHDYPWSMTVFWVLSHFRAIPWSPGDMAVAFAPLWDAGIWAKPPSGEEGQRNKNSLPLKRYTISKEHIKTFNSVSFQACIPGLTLYWNHQYAIWCHQMASLIPGDWKLNLKPCALPRNDNSLLVNALPCPWEALCPQRAHKPAGLPLHRTSNDL